MYKYFLISRDIQTKGGTLQFYVSKAYYDDKVEAERAMFEHYDKYNRDTVSLREVKGYYDLLTIDIDACPNYGDIYFEVERDIYRIMRGVDRRRVIKSS